MMNESSNTNDGVYDVVIVGAGISGISLASVVARLGFTVLVIDQSPVPPEHSSARSVALYSKSYAYTTAISGAIAGAEDFLRNPPPEFDTELLIDRDTFHVFSKEHAWKGLELYNTMCDFPAANMIRKVLKKELVERVPILNRDYPLFAILEQGSGDLDPHAMWRGFHRGFKYHGGRLLNRAEFQKAAYIKGEWRVETSAGNFVSRLLINAAGAWGDDVALKSGINPIGLQPYNRTALVCQPEAGTAMPREMPFVFFPFDDLYFRISGGSITMSPADEIPMPPCDAYPEDMDVASTMAKFEEVSSIRLAPQKPKAWAGQRTFTRDKNPAVGFDADNPRFFWLVGQGGFGIESAWSLANIAASILTDKPLPSKLAVFGLSTESFSPKRFTTEIA